MSGPSERLAEDRHLRDAARALLQADVENLRADLAQKGVGKRALGRAGESAAALGEEAIDVLASNKGIVAGVVAALALWFAREPILDALLGKGDE